ncbi:MAG TPA: serine hydrolase [Rhodanobacter sp.]|nr:serine hydrolase [Rhodanobacter sp.]
MKIRTIGLIAFVTMSLNVPVMASPPLHDLDAYVHQTMQQWQVPGMAVAVVKDGKVVLARGYGVRELGKPDKVDADTLFDIGSNTKSFTAAALGTLVTAGKLDWDAHVADHISDFRLRSPYVTQQLTLRDLLSHRSGYCDPGMWYTSDASDVIRRMRYQQPDYAFRAHFCYNNIMYLTAARFIPAVTGESWDQYVAGHLFKPLGMTRTVTTDAEVAASSDVAMPHGMVDGKPAVIRRYWAHNMDLMSPVGGINSSANDMSRWLLMLLADGSYNGKTVLDKAVVAAMETPQIPVPTDAGVGREIKAWMPGGDFYSYGLGLLMNEYAGHKLVWHAGDIDGMASAMIMVPDQHLGIMVMTNMTESGSRFGVVMHILQQYLQQPADDVGAMLFAQTRKAEAAARLAEKKLADTRRPKAMPPLALADYAGKYADDYNGTARVTLEKGHLVLRLGNPNFVGDLQHWHDDTFRVSWRYRYYGDGYVTFAQDLAGAADKLSLPQMDMDFERVKTSKETTK